MKNKRTILIALLIISLFFGYLLWANQRADYYSQISRLPASEASETNDTQKRVLALEKSVQLWPKTENILTLADLYISIGRNDLAKEIMVGRGDPRILNKLGNLYLGENKIEGAEKAFIKAKNKKINPESLKGLILVVLKKGDRGEVENYLNQLSDLDPNSAGCYSAFAYLNDFNKSKKAFAKAKSCNLYGIDKYFSTYNEAQNPLYLRLEAANLYYSTNYLNLAEKDILALIKEKDNYRDAHILASKIYEKSGDKAKADEYKQKALKIDPVSL
ncbi:hypothetical protein C4544_00325 [candidate division WS5 bacterium]|uniref:Tetratricopeptide repeat protein n=1 Tax=candidate division WS5 bacterium TaxID=2093353 RepID=A0A419DGW3_9BACT|nr:MAG: hypothetical protein C4544_00325 [candidate division WS5 bacterium]